MSNMFKPVFDKELHETTRENHLIFNIDNFVEVRLIYTANFCKV